MRQELWQWMVAAVLCGLGGQLLPGGESGALSKHWRLLCGVYMTLLLIRPISAMMQGDVDPADAWRKYLHGLQEQSAEQQIAQDRSELDAHLAAYAIERMLCEQFDIDANEMTVSVRVSKDEQQVESVYVALTGAAIWKDSHAIEQYIREAFGCQGTVYIS